MEEEEKVLVNDKLDQKKKSWKRERGNGEKLDWQASERERR